MRCVALMINCQSFKNFESILLLTLTVSIQQYEGHYNTGLPSPAEKARNELEQHFASEVYHTDVNAYCIDDNEKNNKVTNDIMDINENEDCNDEIYQWIENLKAQAEIDSDKKASRLNAFYLPEIDKRLTELCLELWTAVLAPVFNSEFVRVTSAYCETYFKDLREYIF